MHWCSLLCLLISTRYFYQNIIHLSAVFAWCPSYQNPVRLLFQTYLELVIPHSLKISLIIPNLWVIRETLLVLKDHFDGSPVLSPVWFIIMLGKETCTSCLENMELLGNQDGMNWSHCHRWPSSPHLPKWLSFEQPVGGQLLASEVFWLIIKLLGWIFLPWGP